MLIGVLLLIKILSAFELLKQDELNTEHLQTSKNNICRLCNDKLVYDEQNSILFKNNGFLGQSLQNDQFYLYFECPKEECAAFYHSTCLIRHFGIPLRNGFTENISKHVEREFKCKL
ncbi:hypothetical protein ENBRE01_0631 [Enteropsectra breve]|nr:hypothetical protein ENBRE01_0631 [Enteropsectra breve]